MFELWLHFSILFNSKDVSSFFLGFMKLHSILVCISWVWDNGANGCPFYPVLTALCNFTFVTLKKSAYHLSSRFRKFISLERLALLKNAFDMCLLHES